MNLFNIIGSRKGNIITRIFVSVYLISKLEIALFESNDDKFRRELSVLFEQVL